jgi:hypothetical protein
MREFTLAEEIIQLRMDKKALAQGLWDVYALVGGDRDGDETPDAILVGMGVSGYIGSVLDEVRAHLDGDEEDGWV